MRVDLRKMTEPPFWADEFQPRIRAPFSTGWAATTWKLEHELELLDVALVVIEITGPKIEIRRDGWFSARSVLDPPVVVSFEVPDVGPLQYRSGRYDTAPANVKAVALTLERLRAVERYGCAPSAEQYSGWAALPSTTSTDRDKRLARGLLALALTPALGSGGVVPDTDQGKYKAALRAVHPDTASAGDNEYKLDDVLEAGRTLGLRKET